MSQILTTQLPNRNLLGIEDAGLVTESRSIPANQGLLLAGRLLKADGFALSGTDSFNDAYSLLAFDTDTAGPTGSSVPVTTYKAGSFLRRTVETANNRPVDAAGTEALRIKGIFLERSV